MANEMEILKQAIAQGVPFSDLLKKGQVEIAQTESQKQEGLRGKPPGTSMVFPNSQGSFSTKGMNYPINIDKYDNKGQLVQSYKNVPPGVGNIPMGPKTGTVIETPVENETVAKTGGPINYQTEGKISKVDFPQLIITDDAKRAHYDPHPLVNTIYMNQEDLDKGTVLPHEMFHWKQRDFGGLFENPLLTPHPAGPVTEETLFSHYDRRKHDHDRQTQDEFTFFPESKMVPNFTRNVVAEQQMYNNPYTAEGEASMFESRYMNDPNYLEDQKRILENAKYKKTGGKVNYQTEGFYLDPSVTGVGDYHQGPNEIYPKGNYWENQAEYFSKAQSRLFFKNFSI